MNEDELTRFEAELRRARPVRLSVKFSARLQAAEPGAEPETGTPLRPAPGQPPWWGLWRWLAPAMALAVAGLFAGWGEVDHESVPPKLPEAIAYELKANDVQVDHELISSYDVVATLPGGQSVRFRCRQWKDQLVLTDKKRGVEIEQDSPRVEVVPVRFETY